MSSLLDDKDPQIKCSLPSIEKAATMESCKAVLYEHEHTKVRNTGDIVLSYNFVTCVPPVYSSPFSTL